MHPLKWLCLVLALAGCPRLVPVFNGNGDVPTGSPCADDGQCATGRCTDGYCCSADCGAGEACNIAGSLGRCAPATLGTECGENGCTQGVCVDGRCCSEACDTAGNPLLSCVLPRAPDRCVPRQGGDPCRQGAQCPTGFCVDGVCCESACDGVCRACAAPGRVPGLCQLIASNTDPGNECGSVDAPCQACFAGLCLSATPGTNPEGRCPTGLTCGATTTCLPANGHSCTGASECASGLCLGEVCTAAQATAIEVGTSVIFQQAQPLGVVGLDDGALGVLVELRASSANGVHTVLNYLEYRDSQWFVFDIPSPSAVAAVRGLGNVALVVSGSVLSPSQGLCGSDLDPTFDPCGVTAHWVGDGARALSRETIITAAELGTDMRVCEVELAIDENANIMAAVGVSRSNCFALNSARELRVFARSAATRTWSAVGPAVWEGGLFAVIAVGGAPGSETAAVYTQTGAGLRDKLVALRLRNGVIERDEFPAGPCQPAGRGRVFGSALLVAGRCVTDDLAGAAFWDPARPAGARWSAHTGITADRGRAAPIAVRGGTAAVVTSEFADSGVVRFVEFRTDGSGTPVRTVVFVSPGRTDLGLFVTGNDQGIRTIAVPQLIETFMVDPASGEIVEAQIPTQPIAIRLD